MKALAPERLFLYVFGGVGLILLTIASVLAVRQLEPNDHIQTVGVVVDHRERVDSEGDRKYASVVEWRAPDGNTYRVTGQVYSLDPTPVGTEIPVSYPPGQPERAYLDDFLSRWFPPLILTVLAVFFGAIGIIIHFMSRSRRRARA